MTTVTCLHKNLVLIPEAKGRVRCRHCHLTIHADELSGYCPECYEVSGQKRNDFDETDVSLRGKIEYLCEDCGVTIPIV